MACMSFGRRHVTALLALVLLSSIPAAAQARNFKVDGRVTGPPTAKGGSVTVPLQLTARAGRSLKLGTRKGARSVQACAAAAVGCGRALAAGAACAA
jgi:hypothetical protein